MPALLACLCWVSAELWESHPESLGPVQLALQRHLLAFLCAAVRQGGGAGAALLKAGVEEVVEAVRSCEAGLFRQVEIEQRAACTALAEELLAACQAAAAAGH